MIENKNKTWFRRTDALIAAFIVPVLIMIIIYVERGIFPFGSRTYLRTDLYHQYAPFMSEFQYKLTHGGSLLYSWNVGMGVNFSALYAYYLASPLNWLVALAPKAYLIEFINIMIILKTGLAGLTMTYYLGKHSKNSTFAPAFFGIFYALSGYMAAYSWNIMWLDCIVLFPLICLGLEKLVYEKRGLLYAVTLGLSILSNYYISIMICIFMVVYFIALSILKGRQGFGSFMGSFGIFAGFSLLAGGIAMAVVCPEIFALQYTASEDMTLPQTVNEYFSIVEELARHMMGVATEQTLDHWPNIYCGVAIFPLVLLFIANTKISLKEKIVYSVLAVLFLASFSLNILSFVWHGLHYPNSLPARQSFIYIWLILFMSFKAVDELEGVNTKGIAIATLASVAFIFLCQAVVKDDAFTWSVWYLSLGFVAVYCLILFLFRTGKMGINLATFLLLAICAIEAAVNMTTTGISTTSREAYLKNNDSTMAVVDYVKDDRDFYRFEMNDRNAKDDGAWLNFHTVSLFSSMAHEDISDLYKHLGCVASTNAYCIEGSTPLVDALFDVKYAIYQGYNNDPHADIVCECDETRLYKNEYCLPLGFMIPDGLESKWVMEAGSPILVQNQLGTALGAGKVLEQVDGFSEGSAYTFTVPEDGRYYAYSENSKTDEIKVKIGDTEKTYEKVNRGYLIELGWLEKNTIVYLEAADESSTMVHAFRFNYDALGRIMDELGKSPMQVNTYDDTHIYSGVDVAEAGTLATTIPYDNGWTVKVDGIEVTPGKFLGSFISLELTSGHHDIEFTYMPEGLKIGCIISAGSIIALLIIFIITLIVDHNRRRKAEFDDDEDDEDDDSGSNVNGSDDNGSGDNGNNGSGNNHRGNDDNGNGGSQDTVSPEPVAKSAEMAATATVAAQTIDDSEIEDDKADDPQPEKTVAEAAQPAPVEEPQPAPIEASQPAPSQSAPVAKVNAEAAPLAASVAAEAARPRSRKRRRSNDPDEEIIIKKNDEPQIRL